MPDNTNVNNNASVVVVGRTAPVPPGQQKSEKSVPVVIASDQSTIPVAEQNKVASEVALSLLGIPRSEVALGIFADVNTYDVNPTEWAAQPEVFNEVSGSGYTAKGNALTSVTPVADSTTAVCDFGSAKSHCPSGQPFSHIQMALNIVLIIYPDRILCIHDLRLKIRLKDG